MIERRGFIKGLLIGTSAAASTALVKLATPEDVKALTVNKDVGLVPSEIFPDSSMLGHEVYVLTQDGYQPIGYLTSFTVHSPSIEITTHLDGEIQLVPGLSRGHATFSSRSPR